jgi:hypothetical protein
MLNETQKIDGNPAAQPGTSKSPRSITSIDKIEIVSGSDVGCGVRGWDERFCKAVVT